MDFNQELIDSIKASNKSIDVLKGEMLERITYLEAASAKANRPNLSGGSFADNFTYGEQDHRTEDRKHFDGFVRNGNGNDTGVVSYKSLSASSGPDGGFGIPKVIDGMIETLAVNVSPIRSIAHVVQVSTPDYHKLVNAHNSSLSAWVGEKAPRTSTNTPQLEDVNPPMGELYSNPQATQTMLDDVYFNAEQWLAEELALEFGRAEGAAFISGNGVNQPIGFLSGTAPVATADATRAFGTLQYTASGASGAFATLTSTVNPVDALFLLVASLKAQYRKNAVFIMNKKTLFAIMGFKDYQGRYVFNPATAPGMADTLLGYPIVEAEDMPDYTSANGLAIAFGNFQRGYIIVDRIGTRVIRDPFSNKPYVGFYTTKRVGGSLLNSEAIKILKFAAS